MKLLVTGAAGFIGSTYVRLVGDEHEVRVLDKLTYAGRRENLPEGDRAGRRGDRGPEDRPRGDGGVRRGRQLRRRVPRRPLDRRPGRLRPHPRDRHRHPARRRPRARRRPLPAGLDRRGLRLDRVRLLHRDLAARPLLALLGDQGGRRPARLRPRPHLRDRGLDRPRLQQLRPAPVPGEADPADGPERDPRRLAAGLRRRPPGPQLALRRGLLPRHPHGADEAAAPARPTTSAAPTSARTSRSSSG